MPEVKTFSLRSTLASIVNYRRIDYQSPEYKLELELRHRVLRVPLGLDLYDGTHDNLHLEKHYFHYGAFNGDGNLLACVFARPLSSRRARIKQMVVQPEHQGRGIGKSLLAEFEKQLSALGLNTFIVHARKHAAGFYLKLGYQIEGEEFVEVSLPHYRMIKTI